MIPKTTMPIGGAARGCVCRFALTVLFASLLVAPAATLAKGPLQAHTGLCAPKRVTILGKPAVAHCGPATAVAKAAGQTFQFKNGSCTNLSSGFALVLGTTVIGSTTNARLPLFTIIFNKAATKASVSWTFKAAKYGILIAKASLNSAHSAGGFSGLASVLTSSGKLSKVAASGSFHC